MSKRVISAGDDVYRATCSECGCVFTYEREDVRHNYVSGGERVSCPHCGHDCGHYGAMRGPGHYGHGGRRVCRSWS